MFPGIGRRNNGKTFFLFDEFLIPVFREKTLQDFASPLCADIPKRGITEDKPRRRINIIREKAEWQAGR